MFLQLTFPALFFSIPIGIESLEKPDRNLNGLAMKSLSSSVIGAFLVDKEIKSRSSLSQQSFKTYEYVFGS